MPLSEEPESSLETEIGAEDDSFNILFHKYALVSELSATRFHESCTWRTYIHRAKWIWPEVPECDSLHGWTSYRVRKRWDVCPCILGNTPQDPVALSWYSLTYSQGTSHFIFCSIAVLVVSLLVYDDRIRLKAIIKSGIKAHRRLSNSRNTQRQSFLEIHSTVHSIECCSLHVAGIKVHGEECRPRIHLKCYQ